MVKNLSNGGAKTAAHTADVVNVDILWVSLVRSTRSQARYHAGLQHYVSQNAEQLLIAA